MPSIATVTVLTGSFMTPTPTDVLRRSDCGQERHVVRDLWKNALPYHLCVYARGITPLLILS